MLRDGVCDEATNVARCLYDGGDCCKENKDEGLCRDCKCIMAIDQQKLEDQFRALDIKPVKNPEYLETIITAIHGWKVEVKNVVSSHVCSVLCLDHKKADELNTWQYLTTDNERICKCGWIESKFCPEKMAMNIPYQLDATTMDQNNAFVQLKKTVPCGMYNMQDAINWFDCFCFFTADCLAAGFQIQSESSEDAKVANGDIASTPPSVWHCLESCRLYADCVWISWKEVANDNAGSSKQLRKLIAAVHLVA